MSEFLVLSDSFTSCALEVYKFFYSFFVLPYKRKQPVFIQVVFFCKNLICWFYNDWTTILKLLWFLGRRQVIDWIFNTFWNEGK